MEKVLGDKINRPIAVTLCGWWNIIISLYAYKIGTVIYPLFGYSQEFLGILNNPYIDISFFAILVILVHLLIGFGFLFGKKWSLWLFLVFHPACLAIMSLTFGITWSQVFHIPFYILFSFILLRKQNRRYFNNRGFFTGYNLESILHVVNHNKWPTFLKSSTILLLVLSSYYLSFIAIELVYSLVNDYYYYGIFYLTATLAVSLSAMVGGSVLHSKSEWRRPFGWVNILGGAIMLAFFLYRFSGSFVYYSYNSQMFPFDFLSFIVIGAILIYVCQIIFGALILNWQRSIDVKKQQALRFSHGNKWSSNDP